MYHITFDFNSMLTIVSNMPLDQKYCHDKLRHLFKATKMVISEMQLIS